MFLHSIPPPRTLVRCARGMAGWLRPGCAALVVLVLVACGDSSGPGGGGGSGTLSGTVRTVGGGIVEGAIISVGARQATSDASGRFELAGLPVGAATVEARRPGYVTAQATVTINAGANTTDFTLTEQEIYTFGAMAAYVPAGVGSLRGAIITLGGPNTSGFVTGGRIAPVGKDELEVSLQALGASLRSLARSARVALLGSSTTGMLNSDANDAVLFGALGTIATLSGRVEIEDAPILMFTLSGGAHEGAGLVSRHPDRAIGLHLRVPASALSLTAPSALAVPTYVMQAGLDVVVDNAAVRQAFLENRSRGGLWALAVEPEAAHDVATDRGNAATIGWITTALSLRLPAAPSNPLIALDQTSGWLGDQTTLEIASWTDFVGDRLAASWLLSQIVASAWKALGTPADGT